MLAPVQSSIERDPDEVDNPAVATIYRHWKERAAGRWAPTWRDIDIMMLPPPLLPYVLVCDVTADNDFIYRYWGRGHTNYHGRDYTQKRLSEMKPDWVRDLLKHQYMRVLESREPRAFETRYDGVTQAVYSIRMPLSDDGEALTGVLGLADRASLAQTLARWVSEQRQDDAS
ncbi:MAG: hypothetical protein WD075_07870 [Rhodospirillales bacterium]